MEIISVSLYMLVFALISALVLIGFLLRPKPTYLKVVEEALNTKEETEFWLSREGRASLSIENHFIGSNLSIYFAPKNVIFERLGKRQKVTQKLVIDNKNILSSQKSFEGKGQTLYNGVIIYDEYFVNIVFKNSENKIEKVKMLYILDDNDSTGNEKVDKIRLNAYVDVIAEKINNIALKNRSIEEKVFK